MKLIVTLLLTIATTACVQAQTLVTNATLVANVGTGQNWTTPTLPTQSATLNNGNPQTSTLLATGFDFSTLPTNASVLGFTVVINKNADATVSETLVSIVKNGVILSDNKAAAGDWSATATNSTYGGSSDVWGGGTWLATDLNANFGVALSVNRTAGVGKAYVNSIEVTVHYAVLAPIILTSFDVSKTAENYVHISWATSTEDKVKMMYIERSTDGRNFSPIFTVTPVGARNRYTKYSVVDKTPVQGTNYYRLMEIDYDGNQYYFDIKSVSISKQGARFQAFYNGSEIKANVAGVKGNFSLTLHDAGGRLLNNQQLNISSGSYQASIPTPGRAGVYIVNLRGEGFSETAKIYVGK